ncbi:MAG TPA: TolC family protein [Tepidisphaeraceae bacterium]|jgi:outer membrane protein|nr:TolC family protein [Tepidisphaeraceae bacterium]
MAQAANVGSNSARTNLPVHRLLPSIALLVGGAGLTGCAVDQEKEVSIYRDVISAPTTRPIHEQGKPLTLVRALQLANSNNEQLSISGEDYLQSLIDKDRAAAAFFPTISLAPTYFFQDKVSGAGGSTIVTGGGTGGGSGTIVVSGGSGQRNERFDVPVTGSWNLFNSFRDVANRRRANATAEQQRDLLLDLQAALLLDVARVYYEVLRSEQSVRVLENALKVQEERLRDTTGRQRAGLARPLDVAQSQAQASQTRVQLLQARADVINGRSTLAFLIDAPVHSVALPDGFDPSIDLPALEAVLRSALAARRDFSAAQAAVRAARQEVAGAFNQYYPSLNLNVNYFLTRDSTPTDSDWNGLLSLDIPIFTAGLIHADVRTAWSRYRQAVFSENQLRRLIDSDVRIAMENLTSTLARLAELRVQATAAREALRQADESYRAGLATNLERLTAQDQVLSAELQLASAEYERKFLYLSLLRQSGQLHLPENQIVSLNVDPVPAQSNPAPAQR